MNLFCNICVHFYSTPCLWIFLHFVTWKFSISLSFLNSLIPFYFISYFFSRAILHIYIFSTLLSLSFNVVHVCRIFHTHTSHVFVVVGPWRERVGEGEFFLYVITLLGITIKRGGVWYMKIARRHQPSFEILSMFK